MIDWPNLKLNNLFNFGYFGYICTKLVLKSFDYTERQFDTWSLKTVYYTLHLSHS